MSFRPRRTSDPIADAEAFSEDSRPVIGYCEVCGCPIYGSDETHDADDGYDFDGEVVCADHLKEYFEDNKIR